MRIIRAMTAMVVWFAFASVLWDGMPSYNTIYEMLWD